jgi:hypothetical protein
MSRLLTEGDTLVFERNVHAASPPIVAHHRKEESVVVDILANLKDERSPQAGNIDVVGALTERGNIDLGEPVLAAPGADGNSSGEGDLVAFGIANLESLGFALQSDEFGPIGREADGGDSDVRVRRASFSRRRKSYPKEREMEQMGQGLHRKKL